ncbi:unnamed protein product [Caenorhabditis sp. 36 PRJEB53466]|nr:unnamed protein product [Caenorhabditis sp. 36 PRJEB53466]
MRHQAPVLQQHWPSSNSYIISPQQLPQPSKHSFTNNEILTAASTNTNYNEFEKELNKLKPGDPEPREIDNKLDLRGLNSTTTTPAQSITYIRESSSGGYSPDAFWSGPLPYRPAPFTISSANCPPYSVSFPIAYRGAGNQFLDSYATALPQQKPLKLTPSINDCCGKCGAPCKFHSKRNVIALAAKLFETQFVPRREKDFEDEPKDPKCNNEKLKDLMSKVRCIHHANYLTFEEAYSKEC